MPSRITTPVRRTGRFLSLLTMLALLMAACGDASPEAGDSTSSPTPGGTETDSASTSEPDSTGDPTEATRPSPELDELTVGLSVSTMAFAPFYWAQDQGLWEDLGLDVELVLFRSGGDGLQAFTGGAVDVVAGGLAGAINLVTAGNDVKAFWGGMNAADFAWYMQPDYESWEDLQGGTIGITSPGSLTDYLIRIIAEQNGLEPEVDVQIVAAGPPAAGFTALRAGELDATFLSPPTKYVAEDEGFTLLARQSEELTEEWPKDVIFTWTDFIEENPGTVQALTLGFSQAVEWAEENREEAVEVLAREFETTPEHADRAYDELIPVFYADGRLPIADAMDLFWQSMVDAGDVDEELPLSEWWDNGVREALGFDSEPIP